MKKGYWVVKANVIEGDKQGAYGKLAEGVIAKFNGKFLVRGGEARITNHETRHLANPACNHPRSWGLLNRLKMIPQSPLRFSTIGKLILRYFRIL